MSDHFFGGPIATQWVETYHRDAEPGPPAGRVILIHPHGRPAIVAVNGDGILLQPGESIEFLDTGTVEVYIEQDDLVDFMDVVP